MGVIFLRFEGECVMGATTQREMVSAERKIWEGAVREVEEKGVLLQLTRDNPHTPHVNIGTAACSFFDHLPWRGTHFMVAACAQSLCEHFLCAASHWVAACRRRRGRQMETNVFALTMRQTGRRPAVLPS